MEYLGIHAKDNYPGPSPTHPYDCEFKEGDSATITQMTLLFLSGYEGPVQTAGGKIGATSISC